MASSKVQNQGSGAAALSAAPGGVDASAGSQLVLLLQSESSAEVRAALVAAAVMDCETRRMPLRSIQADHQARGALGLVKGQILPVGSVEFVRAAMSALGLREPEPMGYEGLQDYLHRQVRRTTVGALAELRAPAFIKPVATKLFTGFVYDPVLAAANAQPVAVDEHVAEQMAVLRKLPADTPLWLGEPVRFQCEWRYYVDVRGRILAQARYDADGADDAPLPSAEVVRCAIDSLVAHLVAHGDPHPFALDMGVLENGRTACVEANDGWAVGLYGHARTPGGMAWSARGYVEFLLHRWHSVVRQSRQRKGERVAVEPEDQDDQDEEVASAPSAPQGQSRRAPRKKARESVKLG